MREGGHYAGIKKCLIPSSRNFYLFTNRVQFIERGFVLHEEVWGGRKYIFLLLFWYFLDRWSSQWENTGVTYSISPVGTHSVKCPQFADRGEGKLRIIPAVFKPIFTEKETGPL